MNAKKIAEKLLAGMIAAMMAVQSVPFVAFAAEDQSNDPQTIEVSSDIAEDDTAEMEEAVYEDEILPEDESVIVVDEPDMYAVSAAAEYGDFTYSVNSDGVTASITGYTGEGGDVVIPSEIDGYEVTDSDSCALANCSRLTSITIPDSVTMISNDAFRYCTSLTAIMIPDSVTNILDRAFYGCSSLTTITIPKNVTRIRNYAFYECSGLNTLTIPDSVTSIGDYAF